MSDRLTSASIVARRGMVKLLLDILASVSVAKTLTESVDFSTSSSAIVFEEKDNRGRRLGNPFDFFIDLEELMNCALSRRPTRS